MGNSITSLFVRFSITKLETLSVTYLTWNPIDSRELPSAIAPGGPSVSGLSGPVMKNPVVIIAVLGFETINSAACSQ